MSSCNRLCVPFSSYNSAIHTLIGVYATEEECAAACNCESSSSNNCQFIECGGEEVHADCGLTGKVMDCDICECVDTSSSDSSADSTANNSSSSSSSNSSTTSVDCQDTETNLQITGDVETSAGVWEYLDNEIFTPVNTSAPNWPVGGVAAWSSASGDIYVKFNSGGGWWELFVFERISHKAFLNGADSQTSRPWAVTFVHAPTGSEPDPSAALSVNRVCQQQPAASSSSSSTPFFTCEPEDASIRLTADFKFDGADGQTTAVNNLILAPIVWADSIEWAGTTQNLKEIRITYTESISKWLITWSQSNSTNTRFAAYESNVTDPPPPADPASVPWLLALTYTGVGANAGMSLSSLNVEKYCI